MYKKTLVLLAWRVGGIGDGTLEGNPLNYITWSEEEDEHALEGVLNSGAECDRSAVNNADDSVCLVCHCQFVFLSNRRSSSCTMRINSLTKTSGKQTVQL